MQIKVSNIDRMVYAKVYDYMRLILNLWIIFKLKIRSDSDACTSESNLFYSQEFVRRLDFVKILAFLHNTALLIILTNTHNFVRFNQYRVENRVLPSTNKRTKCSEFKFSFICEIKF